MPNQTSTVTKRYYPTLSEVITVDDLPEFLHFAETGLNPPSLSLPQGDLNLILGTEDFVWERQVGKK